MNNSTIICQKILTVGEGQSSKTKKHFTNKIILNRELTLIVESSYNFAPTLR